MSVGPADAASEERLHTQFHEGIRIHVEGGLEGLLGILVQLLVVSQVGLAGEALITENAGEGLLFSVNASVADELGGHAKRLTAFQALVALGLRVNSPVVLQCHQVGELFLAHRAEKGACFVAILVVEQGSGMPIGTPAVLTHMALLLFVKRLTTLLLILLVRETLVHLVKLWIHFGEVLEPQLLVKSRVPIQTLRHLNVLLMTGLFFHAMVNLLVLLKARHVGEILLANTAVIREPLAVNLHVALQVCKLTKGLSTIRATVTSHLGMSLEFQMVSESFQAETTVEQVRRMSLFMVEERASVSVRASTLITPTKGKRMRTTSSEIKTCVHNIMHRNPRASIQTKFMQHWIKLMVRFYSITTIKNSVTDYFIPLTAC